MRPPPQQLNCASFPALRASLPQLTVLGLKLGAWGRDKYGIKPKKVDALEFYRWVLLREPAPWVASSPAYVGGCVCEKQVLL